MSLRKEHESREQGELERKQARLHQEQGYREGLQLVAVRESIRRAREEEPQEQ